MVPDTGLTYSFKYMEGEPTSEHDFVKPSKVKAAIVMGVLDLDFETYPKAVGI